jgi:hypothetical protein
MRYRRRDVTRRSLRRSRALDFLRVALHRRLTIFLLRLRLRPRFLTRLRRLTIFLLRLCGWTRSLTRLWRRTRFLLRLLWRLAGFRPARRGGITRVLAGVAIGTLFTTRRRPLCRRRGSLCRRRGSLCRRHR